MSKICSITANIRPKSGNKVSKSKIKTKRVFFPNIQTTSFESVMGKLKLKVSASTIRTVRKYGGFDNYLVNTKPKRLTKYALVLRKKIMKKTNFVFVKKTKNKEKKIES